MTSGPYRENQKSKGICETCGCLTTTTMTIMNYVDTCSGKVAQNVLLSICDKCGDVVGIPAQSLPSIIELTK